MSGSQLQCPCCGTPISSQAQRRMHQFWRGLQAVQCPGCGRRLQDDSAFRLRLQAGGAKVRVGLTIGLVWSAFVVLNALSSVGNTIFAVLSIGLVLAGIFLTATRPDSVRLEEAGED